MNSLIGDVLGWVIVLALMSPFVLILYVVLKKSRWRGLYPDPYGKKMSVRVTLGSREKVEEKLLGQLANPGAHAETMKLDLSDPQARANVEQFLQGLGAMDPQMKEKLEEALRNAASAHGKATFTFSTSKVVFGADPAAASEFAASDAAGSPMPPAPGSFAPPVSESIAPPGQGSTILDGASVPAPPPLPGLGPPAHGPTLLGGAPDWREELHEKWQRERDELAHEEHVTFTRSLERNRASLRAILRPVRYAISGLCVLAVVACLLKASRGNSEYNLLALVLAGCAAWAWFSFNPDDVA